MYMPSSAQNDPEAAILDSSADGLHRLGVGERRSVTTISSPELLYNIGRLACLPSMCMSTCNAARFSSRGCRQKICANDLVSSTTRIIASSPMSNRADFGHGHFYRTGHEIRITIHGFIGKRLSDSFAAWVDQERCLGQDARREPPFERERVHLVDQIRWPRESTGRSTRPWNAMCRSTYVERGLCLMVRSTDYSIPRITRHKTANFSRVAWRSEEDDADRQSGTDAKCASRTAPWRLA